MEKGEDGKSYQVAPQVIFRGKDAINRILQEFQNEITVYHFIKGESHRCSIGSCGIEPYFEIEFILMVLLSVGMNSKRKHGTQKSDLYFYNEISKTTPIFRQPILCRRLKSNPETMSGVSFREWDNMDMTPPHDYKQGF